MKNSISITNFTCNGKCSNCGQCCGDILHLSKREIKDIRAYVKKHRIKPTPQNVMVDIDNTCPFRDEENKKCKIYEARPCICRAYRCDRTPEDAIKCRELTNGDKLPRSMRNLFFKDNSNALKMRMFVKTYDINDKEIVGDSNEN